jgi:2-oxoglutarate ferredoxin oxidoreductase subunit alpha
VQYLRIKFPGYDYKQYNKVQGLPFTEGELKQKFNEILEG